MQRLTIATTATANPMGAQAYESAIRAHGQAALDALEDGWLLGDVIARSIRSPLAGNRRLPMGWLTNATPSQRRLIGKVIYRGASVVHRMDLILPPPPGPDIVTLHDMVAWDFSDESTPVRAAVAELQRADAVVCVSDFTARTAQERMGLINTVVVPNGVSTHFFNAQPLRQGELSPISLSPPYILYAGGSARRKNLPALAEAWRMVSPSNPTWTLALSGPVNETRERLFSGIPRVVHLGRLRDEMMPRVMAGAGAAVVPSLYEGFGLPALEAMAAGVPVVASNRSSLPEVVADCGTLVEPTPMGLAEGLEHVMSAPPEVRRQVSRGVKRARSFTWERSAASHAEVWTAFGNR